MDIPLHESYLTIHQLMDILIVSGYYEHLCCTDFCMDICFHFSWIYIPKSGKCVSSKGTFFLIKENSSDAVICHIIPDLILRTYVPLHTIVQKKYLREVVPFSLI